VTRLQRLVAEARIANQNERTITHETARSIAEFFNLDLADPRDDPFVVLGWLPNRMRTVMEIHQALTFGHVEPDMAMALARYMRKRVDQGLTGEFFGWQQLIH